jgi:glutamate racemase
MGPIGIFDSGYGGLTVFRSIAARLPQYDYLYLGDNARAPYGNRSFATVYEYTRECVAWFFAQGCPLVILACNTASAKALRSIQQQYLPILGSNQRVLGVIRPTAEVIGSFTKTKEIGVLGTKGTVSSGSYGIEIAHFFPDVKVYQQACPLWVPLIENGEWNSPGTDYFVQQYLDALLLQSPAIDTILLACTHYPLLEEKILHHLPAGITLVAQGGLVAASLEDYLARHTEITSTVTQGSSRQFCTTDDPEEFDRQARTFFGETVKSIRIHLS